MGSGFDSTWALLHQGYEFGERRFVGAGRDAIATRIMLRRTVVVRGAAAAERFYDSRSFVRDGAMPRRVRRSFIGEGGVQSLDGDAHLQRKALFMDLMSAEGLDRLEQLTAGRWTEAVRDWAGRDEVVLLDAISELLCRAACDWVGVDLPADQVRRRTGEFLAMIDSPAALGPRHRRGRLARRSSERWIRDELRRAGDGDRPIDQFARAFASDDGPGEQVAAVEVINLLRPIVAVGRYVAFAAAALQEHPTWRDRLHDDPAWIPAFVHEVRRTAPFFPMVAAVSTADVEFDDIRVPAGTRVLLDLYATNRDPRRWHRPEVFDPRRHHAARRHRSTSCRRAAAITVAAIAAPVSGSRSA